MCCETRVGYFAGTRPKGQLERLIVGRGGLESHEWSRRGLDPRSNDGAGPPTIGASTRAHCPPGFMLNDAVFEYIKSLLQNELAEIRNMAEEAAALGSDHHVVGALDWYRDRDADNHNLHKDTTGSTLFVALHYANEQPILGAEYICDHWPMPSFKDAAYYYGKVWARPNAPWCKEAHAWSDALVRVLEEARAYMKDLNFVQMGHPTVECKQIEPFGLITFVDELIYHATPLEGRRTDHDRKELYTTVDLGGASYKLPVPGLWWANERSRVPQREDYALTRAVSRDQMTAPVRDNGKRRFARVWISVPPRKWTAWRMNPVWS